ncbi:MAG TPA: YezD family protein [Ktedonobacterales bacterium]|nr:YezD family protein [Ktedonobacterales bacterium]
MAVETHLTLTPEEEQVVRALLAALRRIRYGSVQIAVQDGRVVQIDTLEKQRFAPGGPSNHDGAARAT